MIGWACDIDGNPVQPFPDSEASMLIAEGEDDEGGEGGQGGGTEPTYTLPVGLPATSAPTLTFGSLGNSFDTFSPVGGTFRQVTTLGNYTESTTVPDAVAPGTHWVHIVDQQVTSPTVWSFTESLVMGFNETTTGSDTNGGTSGFNHFGTMILTFTASQGILSPSNAGVAWSLDITFVESLGFAFSTSGSSTAIPNNLSSTALTTLADGPEGDGSTPWDGSELPASYSGSASWNSGVSIVATVSGSFAISSTPSIVAGATERNFTAIGGVDRSIDLNLSGGWAMVSSSGNLTIDPASISPYTTWPATSPVPQDGNLGLDFAAADSALTTGSPDSFSPIPEFEGSGHAHAASGAVGTSLRTGGGVDFDITGNIRNGQLQSIAGDLVSGLQDSIGDDFQDNRVYVYQHNVSETNPTTTTSIKAKIGYGWNLSPEVSASLNAENKIGLSASPAGELVTSTIHDFAEIEADGGTQDLDFIGLAITLNETVSDAPVLTSNFSGTLEIANMFISKGYGELTINDSDTESLSANGWVTWNDTGVSMQREVYDTDWTRHHDQTMEEMEPVYQYQFLDEVYSSTTVSKNNSTGDITLAMQADGTVTETGTAGSTWEESVDSSYTVTMDNYITYYEPYDMSSWQRHANNGTITETFQQTASGGASFDSSQQPSLSIDSGTITGDTEPQVSGAINYTYTTSFGGGNSNTNTSSQGLLDWLANGINSTPIIGNITALTNQVLAPMVQSTVGDEFLLTTSDEALIGFTVGAAAITVVTGGAGASAGSAIAGCTYTGVIIGGAVGGAGEYLLLSGLANGINPAATDPTIAGTATAALSGAAGGILGKWLGLLGCFVEGTQVTLSAIAHSQALEDRVWTDSYSPAEVYADSLLQSSDADVATSSTNRLKVPIQEVLLGSRVATRNPKPWEYDDSLPEPDEIHWQQISLTIQRSDGATVDVELLRPANWVEENGLVIGQSVPFQIPELDVNGLATVNDISECPRLAVGDGSFVTGRFVTRRVEETVELELEDGSTIEGTAVHPIWSVDRDDWVLLGELFPGELLRTDAGAVAVVALRVKVRPTSVYNLEVHGEHVYQIGDLGLLVHNACSNSKILGRNMAGGDELVAKSIRSKGYAAGHVVPAVGFSRRSTDVVNACNDARATLKAVWIDINDAANGFWTNSSRHLGSHTDDYLLDMGEALRGLTDKGLVQDALESLRTALFSGLY